MIYKLPKWVEIGGFVLSVIAGSVNAIALLGFMHQGVSHLSGVSTLLGVELAGGNLTEMLHLLLIIVSFVLGSAISGFIIGNESLKLGRRYSAALIIEALLLLLAMHYLKHSANLGQYLAATACGLQNAMTSTFSGAVIRTTHVTGIFTDLGIMFGLFLRGRKPDRRRITLYSILIAGFISGGVIGALAFTHLAFNAMWLPALSCSAIALAYAVYWQRQLLTITANKSR